MKKLNILLAVLMVVSASSLFAKGGGMGGMGGKGSMQKSQSRFKVQERSQYNNGNGYKNQN